MTNLPTNPTKSELLERHWLEFLQYVKDHQKPSSQGDKMMSALRPQLHWEDVFWGWYVRNKMPSNKPPEPN